MNENLNSELEKFSAIMQDIIYNNLNIAKEKTHGDGGLVIALNT